MQTSKVKVGELYALKRRGELVRFYCSEIVTRRTDVETKSEIFGDIVEDRKDGENKAVINVNPQDLLGPYAEQAELVERIARETAEREAAKVAREKQARVDRLALYEFVGVTPPAKREEYNQLFRVSYGTVDFSNEGKRILIERVRALREGQSIAAKAIQAATDLSYVKG